MVSESRSLAIDRVDPELRHALTLFPELDLTQDLLPGVRQSMSGAYANDKIAGLSEYQVSLPDALGGIDLIICRPSNSDVLPALCCIHGGGFVGGSARTMAAEHRNWAIKLNAVLVFVDYRLAPEHRFPQPLEDCYAALRWMFSEARSHGIDSDRIALWGISAGGGLAAGLAILARDRGSIPLVSQHLWSPMLDDRTATDGDQHPYVGQFVWSRPSNTFAWQCYLGQAPGGDGVSPYAAPARLQTMEDLPPTYVAVGSLDLFMEESVEYVRRITRAGVRAELHVYPGVYHAATAVSDAAVIKRWVRDSREALVRSLHWNW